MTITGGCRCGAVRYVVAMDTLPQTYACHCRNCQIWSGSAFSLHAMLAEDHISTTGPVVRYAHSGEQGEISEQRLCGTCHTRIFNTNSAAPGMAFLRAGTLDDGAALAPMAHIWVKRKQHWVVIPDGVPHWPESPTPEQFAAAVQAAGDGR